MKLCFVKIIQHFVHIKTQFYITATNILVFNQLKFQIKLRAEG
jgi:hypothetical protein